MTTATKTSRKSGIILVDDHPMLRRGIAELINGEKDLEVLAEAGSAAEVYELFSKHHPAMLVIDVSLEGENGIELMQQLSYKDPNVKMLAYSMHDEQLYAERALRAGAKGYVMKHHPPEVFLDAVRDVLKGRVYLSETMSGRLLGKLVGAGANATVSKSPIESLSNRELEVLQHMGRGLTTAQIADKLTLSIKTIETYREHLKHKLNVQTGPELLRYAIEWSLDQN
jgi:DNA-binding NarL/FixJ family response regulator